MLTVRFLSRLQAEALSPCPDTVVISITTPGDLPASLPEGFRDVLRLSFDDLSEEMLGVPLGAIPDDTPDDTQVRWKVYQLARATDAEAICDFLAYYARSPVAVSVVVHCDAGVSRSAAVARFIAGRYSTPIVNVAPDTSYANSRLLRLLNKVDQGLPLDIRPVPDIEALRLARR